MTLVQTAPKKIYIYIDISIPGIYHNPSLGLISLSSDGTDWITIADKNLGATTVYNNGDTLSENNAGKFYQRGNCYGFPYTGATSSSSSTINTSNYGPDNYYSSNVYRSVSNQDWSNPRNDNLWGNTTDTLIARKGPCNEGFYIPEKTGFTTLKNILNSLGLSVSNGENIKNYLKLPYAGYIIPSTPGSPEGKAATGRYLTSGGDNQYCTICQITSGSFISESSSYRCVGGTIRPFKNEAVEPDDTRTVLYQPS